jgi:hypothetical protein
MNYTFMDYPAEAFLHLKMSLITHNSLFNVNDTVKRLLNYKYLYSSVPVGSNGKMVRKIPFFYFILIEVYLK